jgi:hypothetical protein
MSDLQANGASPWHAHVMTQLRGLNPESYPDDSAAEFFSRFYQANYPCVVPLSDWPLRRWSLNDLVERVGNDTAVQIQVARDSNPDYEIQSHQHRGIMPFGAFISALPAAGNDIYMTAQNQGDNLGAMAPIWEGVGALPSFLGADQTRGFIWLGCNTETPVHHDETNNVMCQVFGSKLVRLFAPDAREKLSPSTGVHSHLRWVSDRIIKERDIPFIDVILRPGQGLFLPVGWWHCVRAFAISMTIVYTNFIWPNFWGRTHEIPA